MDLFPAFKLRPRDIFLIMFRHVELDGLLFVFRHVTVIIDLCWSAERTNDMAQRFIAGIGRSPRRSP